MRNSKPRSKKTSFAIVLDGKTEFWYFQMMVRNEKENLNIRIKPELPSKKSLAHQFKLVKHLSKDFNKVFWIIDLDVILKETREVKKGEKAKIQELNEYKNVLNKQYTNAIALIVNNPCLEFWFLLHFESTAKFFFNCNGAEKQLKNYLKDYEKTEKYFTKENNDIYLRLNPNLKNALNNANNLGKFNIKDPNIAICEMQLFFEAVGFK